MILVWCITTWCILAACRGIFADKRMKACLLVLLAGLGGFIFAYGVRELMLDVERQNERVKASQLSSKQP